MDSLRSCQEGLTDVALTVSQTGWLTTCCEQDDSSPVSVFFFDAAMSNRKAMLPLAKNALRKLRTIRHPDVLKFIDVAETESTIYIVTERVQPLGTVISSWGSKSASAREEWLIWGLHRIAVRFHSYPQSCCNSDGRLDSAGFCQ
jgi:SCY1-like protein 1